MIKKVFHKAFFIILFKGSQNDLYELYTQYNPNGFFIYFYKMYVNNLYFIDINYHYL